MRDLNLCGEAGTHCEVCGGRVRGVELGSEDGRQYAGSYKHGARSCEGQVGYEYESSDGDYTTPSAVEMTSLHHAPETPARELHLRPLAYQHVDLAELSRQISLLREEVVSHTADLYRIADLAASAVCMLGAYVDKDRGCAVEDEGEELVCGIQGDVREVCDALVKKGVLGGDLGMLVGKLEKGVEKLGGGHVAWTKGCRDELTPGQDSVSTTTNTFIGPRETEHSLLSESEASGRLQNGSSAVSFSSVSQPPIFSDHSFSRLYDALLHSADTGVSDAPSPGTEIWIQIVGLLQMRNSYLEHAVRSLREEGASAAQDVLWHVEALEAMDEELRDARVGLAGALAEVMDLKVRIACVEGRKGGIREDEEPGKSLFSVSYLHSDGDRAACSKDRKSSAFVNDPASYRPAYLPSTTQSHATVFYFFPARSQLTLMTTPPHSIHWPRSTTLHQIRDQLIVRHEQGETSSSLANVLEIMDQREILGVQLPGPTRDAVLRIGVPDVYAAAVGDGAGEIQAWEAFERVGRVDERGVECSGDDELASEFAWEIDWAGEIPMASMGSGRGCTDAVDIRS